MFWQNKEDRSDEWVNDRLKDLQNQVTKRNNEVQALYDYFDVEYVAEEVRKDGTSGFRFYVSTHEGGFARKRPKKKK